MNWNHDIVLEHILNFRSLDPIFESPRLDEDLRSLVKSTFSEFFQPRKRDHTPTSPISSTLPYIVPTPQNATPSSATSSSSSMEVLEIAAGGGQEVGRASRGSGEGADDPMIIEDDYLQGEDSEVTSAFSGREKGVNQSREGGLIKVERTVFKG